MLKIKLAVVGPARAGKTVVSNFLSDSGDLLGSDYQPTIGCRVLEMEQEMKISNRLERVDIELWDCSGDSKYESCWSAFSHNANGIVFVYNPNEEGHARELNQWYTHFVQNAGMRDEVCLVLSNRFETEDGNQTREKLTNLFADVKHLKVNMDEDSERVRHEFNKFTQNVANYSKSKQEQDEKMILR